MTKTISLQALCLTLLLLCAALLSGSSADAPQHPFPLSKGTYWVYQGTVRWTHDNSNRVSETKVTWRTEILRFIQHGDTSAAIVKGFPTDLDWSNGRPEPSDSLLVESGGKFYLVPSERFTDTMHRLEQPSDSLTGLFSNDYPFLKWPLVPGQKFCGPEDMARPDDMYCWVVSSSHTAFLNNVAGIRGRKRTEFSVRFRTNPDDVHFTFVPGIGITAYGYHHHGTVADTDLKLTEFHQSPEDKK
jgi:hypothetical protein